MKKILLLALVACVVTACETMDGFKTGLSDSYTKVSNLFVSPDDGDTPCPSFVVSEELNSYFDLPEADESVAAGKLSNAKIEQISGQCRLNDTNDIVTISMDIDFTAVAGTNLETGQLTKSTLDMPYFIAVLDANQEILAKDTFSIPLELSGVAASTYHKERLQQNIPVTDGRNPSNYTIITGFQLNEAQLAMAKQQDELSKIIPASGAAVTTPISANKVPVTAIKAPRPETIKAADPFANR